MLPKNRPVQYVSYIIINEGPSKNIPLWPERDLIEIHVFEEKAFDSNT
jgi:hypothetical protein